MHPHADSLCIQQMSPDLRDPERENYRGASLLQLVQALLGQHHRLVTACLYLTYLPLSRKHHFLRFECYILCVHIVMI